MGSYLNVEVSNHTKESGFFGGFFASGNSALQ